jgi:type VI secretion system ImpJ/VasE family protein
MTTEAQVHWHEGLFMQPHHLQWMQRSVFDQFAHERRLTWAFPYGVLDIQISDDELSNMRVRFDRLHAIMPSGREVRVPETTDLPSLDIKDALMAARGPLTISLGVPIWYPSRRNTVDGTLDADYRAKMLYRIAEVESTDENTGENPQPLRVRRLNARLLLEQDDRADLETLPLLRVIPSGGEDVGKPRRDAAYVPPCLLICAAPALRDLLRDLTHRVVASRNELALQITRGGFSLENLRGVQFEQLLRLRTLNRFGALLECDLQVSQSLTPFELYAQLRQMVAELAALRPDRDQYVAPEYDHNQVWPILKELVERIQDHLVGELPTRFMKVTFTRSGAESCFTATLEDKHLTQPNEYFLAIKTRMDPKALAMLVESADKFKLMPPALIDKPVYGVKLVYEPYPPVELPAEVGLCYFKLVPTESAHMWERIQQEKAAAVRWPGMEESDFKLSLSMTIP